MRVGWSLRPEIGFAIAVSYAHAYGAYSMGEWGGGFGCRAAYLGRKSPANSVPGTRWLCQPILWVRRNASFTIPAITRKEDIRAGI